MIAMWCPLAMSHCPADWPSRDPPQLQAQGPLDNPAIIYGQTNAMVGSSGTVSYTDLQPAEGTYSVCFTALQSQVGAPDTH